MVFYYARVWSTSCARQPASNVVTVLEALERRGGEASENAYFIHS